MGTAVNLFSGNLYKGVKLFNFDASLALTMENRTVYYFDSARHNQVSRIQRPSGQSLVFSYNVYGKLIRVTHSLGYTLTLS